MHDLKEYVTLTNLFFTKPAESYRRGLLEIKKIPEDIQPSPKSVFTDVFSALSAVDKKAYLHGLGYDFLKRISVQDPLIASIINTRISQVLNFVKPAPIATNPYCFDFMPLNVEKENKELKERLYKFLLRTGLFSEPGRDTFADFIKKIVRDRLRYDQVNFEIVYNKDGIPAAFYVVDPATIRLYKPTDKERQEGWYTFQVINGEVNAKFKFHEMAWGVFHARSDIENYGYGMSEIEMALHILASKIYAEEYNKYYFLQGGSKGILFLKKTVLSRTQMSGFQEEWQATAAGYPAAHRIPVLSSPFIDDIKYINLDRTNKEMEFSRWIDYCVNVLCAVFCISPQEINFPPRGLSGAGGILQSEGMYAQVIKHSRDKGLRPLLQFIEHLINTYLIFPLTGESYAFVFKGLDELSPKEKIEQLYRECTTWKTVNEVRKEQGLKPLPMGNYIASPIFVQIASMTGTIDKTLEPSLQENKEVEKPEETAPVKEEKSESETTSEREFADWFVNRLMETEIPEEEEED